MSMSEKQSQLWETVDDLISEINRFAKSEVNKVFNDPFIIDIFKTTGLKIKFAYHVIPEREFYKQISKLMKDSGVPKKRIHMNIIDHIQRDAGVSSRVPACTITMNKRYKRPEYEYPVYGFNAIAIYVSQEQIMRFMLRNPGKIDAILQYYKLTIRHEIGHVIDAFHMFGKEWDLVSSQVKEENENYDAVQKKMNELREKGIDDKKGLRYTENMMYFTENPAEKRANEYAGFTEEELDMLYNECNLN